MLVCPSLLLARLLAILAFGAFSDICQVLVPDQSVWVALDNAFGDRVVCVQLQPSLSSTDHDKPSCRGTSALPLQALAHSSIVVGFGANRFARIKSGLVCGGGRRRQIALPYVHRYDLGICCWCGICSLHFQTHEQIELLVGLIVPELVNSLKGGPILHGRMEF